MLLHAKTSCLMVIDMQERLVPAMLAPTRTIRNARVLLTAARRLGVPALLTEQYPQGLGATVREVAEAAVGATVLPKMHFSCMQDARFAETFRALGRRQAVIAGMEGHICVLQTAVSLMDEGFEVFVVTDATSSRTADNERACIDRLAALGAGIVTTEMVVFEWLGQAGTDDFRALLPLVK